MKYCLLFLLLIGGCFFSEEPRWPKDYTCDFNQLMDANTQIKICHAANYSYCTTDAIKTHCTYQPKSFIGHYGVCYFNNCIK